VSSTTSPEAANDRRFPVQQLIHGEWWSPLTSKILLEVVALHRTERWGNMDLRPTDDGGSLNVTPAQYALYPTMIGVTQTNGTIPGLQFHGPSGEFNNNWVPNYTYRAAVSYITGAHAFKIGMEDAFGFVTSTNYLPTRDTLNRPVRYRFDSDALPDQVTSYHNPRTSKQDINHNFGAFIQDRWTLDQLTLNGGVRFDWFTSEIPGQYLLPSVLGRPGQHFKGVERAMDWKDVTPRIGAAYDLQGDGKTAIKVSLNKYVAGQGGGSLTGSANPIGKLTHSQSRTWNDQFFGPLDPRSGNFVVDCNVTDPSNQQKAGTGECAAPTGSNASQFGSVIVPNATPENPANLSDFDVRRGWGKRSYNWEFSAGVQREIMPRVSVDVSYFRRWYGNFTATDNQAVAPSDFKYFSIITPRDTRLPSGGGQQIDGFAAFTTAAAATATSNNKTVFTDDIGAKQIQHWNGVDVSISARLQNGLLLQGGTSTGRQSDNECEVIAKLPETLGNDPTSFCDQVEPWRTQMKLVAAYTLPRYAALGNVMGTVLQNMQLAGTFQSIPGNELTATYSMSNSNNNIRGNELDSNAATGRTIGLPGGLVNGNSQTVSLIAPNSMYDARMNQLDLRIGRIVRFGRTRTTLNLDIFNVFNDNTILNRSTTLSRNIRQLAGAPNGTPQDTTNLTDNFGNPLVNGANNKAPQGNVLLGQGQTINASNTLWTPSTILQARFFKVTATFDF
jgi:hypothetical protein